MKIGIFDPYLDTLGGGEKYMLTAAQCLSSHHSVFLFWDKKQWEILYPQIQKRFGIDLSRVQVISNIFDPKFSTISRYIASLEYDVVLYLSDGSIPFIKPHNFIVHFQFPVEWIPSPSFAQKIKLRNVTSVICNSQFTKEYIDKKFHIKSSVLYPPSLKAMNQADLDGKQNSILTVGRISKMKNGKLFKKQDVLIDIFKKMKFSNKELKFFVVVSYRNEDKKEAEKLKEKIGNSNITLFENISEEELIDLYKKAKIYWHASGFGEDTKLHPELAEHFGIVTVEAMHFGVVPVVINSGGLAEIVDNNINGYLWNTEDELIHKTEELLTHEKLRISFAKKAQEKSKQFTNDRFCQQLQKLIHG